MTQTGSKHDVARRTAFLLASVTLACLVDKLNLGYSTYSVFTHLNLPSREEPPSGRRTDGLESATVTVRERIGVGDGYGS